jgi:hypothetical protein
MRSPAARSGLYTVCNLHNTLATKELPGCAICSQGSSSSLRRRHQGLLSSTGVVVRLEAAIRVRFEKSVPHSGGLLSVFRRLREMLGDGLPALHDSRRLLFVLLDRLREELRVDLLHVC